MGNAIVHFEIIGKDAAKVKAFDATTRALLANPDGNVIGLTTGTSSSS